MKKPKVVILELSKQNAVHWWRSKRPFEALRDLGLIDLYICYDKVVVDDIKGSDVLVFSHAMDLVHVQIAEMAKRAGIKVWVDFDDDYRTVPVHNEHHNVVRACLPNSMALLGLADVVTVSTWELKEAYKDIREDIEVLPNSIFEHEIANKWNERNIWLWRGGNYGMRDVFHRIQDLQTIGHTGAEMLWMGAIPPFLPSQVIEGRVIGWVTVDRFFEFLEKIAPGYVWKPLEMHQFNSCKSNIALLEAAVAGALCVTNSDEDKWRTAITVEQARDQGNGWKRKRFEAQREFILDGYEINKTNTKRLEILENM